MRVRRAALASVTALCLLVGTAVADDDYSFCTVCHGAHGNGNAAINAPKIAGIEPWYLKRQLEHFRAGLRGTHASDIPGSEMQPVALQLDDQAVQKVASYVATFQADAPTETVSGDLKRGRSLYATCAGCHGTHAEGNAALQAPALAGQSDWYLVAQLARFRAGERGFSPDDAAGTQMRTAAGVLPDEVAMRDVVAYINSLGDHPKRGRPRG